MPEPQELWVAIDERELPEAGEGAMQRRDVLPLRADEGERLEVGRDAAHERAERLAVGRAEVVQLCEELFVRAHEVAPGRGRSALQRLRVEGEEGDVQVADAGEGVGETGVLRLEGAEENYEAFRPGSQREGDAVEPGGVGRVSNVLGDKGERTSRAAAIGACKECNCCDQLDWNVVHAGVRSVCRSLLIFMMHKD